MPGRARATPFLIDAKNLARQSGIWNCRGAEEKNRALNMNPILIHYPRPRRNRRRYSGAKRAIAIIIRAAFIGAAIISLILASK